MTSDTVSQSLESLWDAVKGAISCQIVHKDIRVATNKVEAAVIAILIRRDWIVCPEGSSEWQLKSGCHGFPWPLTYAAWPSRRLLSGFPQQTERFIYEGDAQRKVHSVADYVRVAPASFCVCSPPQTMLGLRCLRFYTVLILMFCFWCCFCVMSVYVCFESIVWFGFSQLFASLCMVFCARFHGFAWLLQFCDVSALIDLKL